jgi:hypothetical protein
VEWPKAALRVGPPRRRPISQIDHDACELLLVLTQHHPSCQRVPVEQNDGPSIRRHATGGSLLCVVRATHPARTGAGAVRCPTHLACTGRTAESGGRGEAAVEQSADPVGDDVGRAGPDAGDQCRSVDWSVAKVWKAIRSRRSAGAES